MDKRQIPELTKITFDTSKANNLQDALVHVETDMKAFSKVVSSATNTMDYWQSAMKKIITEPGTNQGYFKQSIMVNKEDAENVLAALQYFNAQKFGSDNKYSPHQWQYDIEAHDASIVSGTMKLASKEAFDLAQAEAKALGGDVWRDPTKKNPYRARYFYPADNAEELTTAAQKTEPFKPAKKLSSAAMKEIRRKEKEDRQRELEEEAAQIVKDEEKRQSIIARETDKTNRMLVAQKKRRKQEEIKHEKDIDAQVADILGEDKRLKKARYKEYDAFTAIREKMEAQKAKEESNKKKELDKANIESKRKLKSSVKVIIGLLTIGVSLLRRLVVSAFQAVSNLQKDTVTAHNLGMSYQDLRNYNLFDKAHGLPEGTTVGAIQDVQNKFGDITRLDEDALATLARVMGSDIVDLILSGLGGESPDKLLEKILDKYFEQYKQGKNSLGMDVGQEQARRELITSLGTVSSDLAKLLAQMIEDYSSSNIGGFENFSEWQSNVKLFGGQLEDVQTRYAEEVAEKYNQVIASFDNLKNNFLIRLANSLDGLLDWLSNFRIGLSDTENYELDIMNKQKNKVTEEGVRTAMSLNEDAARQAVKDVQENIIPNTKYKYKLKDKYNDFSLPLLAAYFQSRGSPDRAQSLYGLDFFKDAKLFDVQAWMERADDIIANLGVGANENWDEFFSYLIEYEALQELEKEGKKHPGEKIDRLTFTRNEEGVRIAEAKKFATKLYGKTPKEWEDVPTLAQGELLPLLKSKASEILSDPTQAQALFEYITKEENYKDNPLIQSIFKDTEFMRKYKELQARLGSSNVHKSKEFKDLVLGSFLKHPELMYEYNMLDKERETMFGLALENLPEDSLNNVGLSLIAANNLPSEIDRARPYNMNYQAGYDKAGNAILTINFEQDGVIFGSKDIPNPAFSDSMDSAGTIQFNNQLALKYAQ